MFRRPPPPRRPAENVGRGLPTPPRLSPPPSAAILACVATLLSACHHISLTEVERVDPNALFAPSDHGAHYAHLFGETYRTKISLHLFVLNDDPDYLYLGLPSATGATSPLGQAPGALRVLDVVPVGARLVIAAETHEVTAASGIREQGGYPMGFICTLSYNGREIPGVLAEYIQTAEPAPPRTPNQRLDETVVAKLSRSSR